MTERTVSESLFEHLCDNRKVPWNRITESTDKSADYCISIGTTELISEIKQLEPNERDRERKDDWGTAGAQPVVAPSIRVQGLLQDAYAQVKKSAAGRHPTMVVVYNNSGTWNWIDTFTVSKAMFGQYGIVVQLDPDRSIEKMGEGYLGDRFVTKDSCRSLSVVGVLEKGGAAGANIRCYHNPFANLPMDPSELAILADSQYVHPNPHDRGFIPWEPKEIET